MGRRRKELRGRGPRERRNGVEALQQKARRRKAASSMCHQCQRNDRGRVVRCTRCTIKRFCKGCMKRWYPHMTEDDFAKNCPFCRKICCCKSCLRMNRIKEVELIPRLNFSESEWSEFTHRIVQFPLPWLKNFNDEQMAEKDFEANIQDTTISELYLERIVLSSDESMYCDNCFASIVDLHRSCATCQYDLCLHCCQELRDGRTPGGHSKIHLRCENKSMRMLVDESHTTEAVEAPLEEWRPLSNWSIPCPPQKLGGCGSSTLELKCLLSVDPKELEAKAEQFLKKKGSALSDNLHDLCPCSGEFSSSVVLRKAASRENSSDNYLYSPSAKDTHTELDHFQMHWIKGEPVVVRNTLESTSGLSWDPMVVCRALRNMKDDDVDGLHVRAIDCSNCCEVEINTHTFFVQYSNGSHILKLLLPDYSFKNNAPRHSVEFVSALPFRQYTDPRAGPLNLAADLPMHTVKTDLGPKPYIAYGVAEEMEMGNSCTKLHCNVADAVNILTHTSDGIYYNSAEEQSDKLEEAIQSSGAVWDIFRREDVHMLEEYLRKHYREFRDKDGKPAEQVIHPIHDQTFFLTTQHKKKLKDEFGIEPWTFEQNLGEAVFIPAGCPHQVRNLKSCIKVGLDFLSPESVEECISLTNEYRALPEGHIAKEDCLQVKKIILGALESILNEKPTEVGVTHRKKRRL